MFELVKLIDKHVHRPTIMIETYMENFNPDSLISKINNELQQDNHLNYVTNVKGEMTKWDAFTKDPEFNAILQKNSSILSNAIGEDTFILEQAWGIRLSGKQLVRKHKHEKHWLSGVFYLSNTSQELFFEELNLSIKPKVGTFIVFDAHLFHQTKNLVGEDVKYAIAFNLDRITETY
jgi:UDP-N-acetyl-D-mannosaminuronic acid transferase (WecB/TagA/CpsF family)|tara:strand:+ start:200 stop:730 length:531 start_codon:yes stop_codon:yes gene_type:complete